MTLGALNQLDQEAFICELGGIFEHSPWVAEAVFAKRPFSSTELLHRAMVEAVRTGAEEKQLSLLRAHPDLAGKAALAGELTESSQQEQAGAGLNRLSPEEFARFHQFNEAYKAKFDFPFILAVKGHSKDTILAAFEARLPNHASSERQTALEQVYRIAAFRLEALFGED
jgi:2-oxo-4-hydroxy-4-carboxy-5-ureidoimidazoline decarboxylase